jgi:DNA-binding protein H-NS
MGSCRPRGLRLPRKLWGASAILHGLTAADVETYMRERHRRPSVSYATIKAGNRSRGKLPPKYVNPETGETWSGHARPPRWVAELKDRSRFLIVGAHTEYASSRAENTVVKRTGKSVSKPRGKLPPKYRNPDTGVTWSGHARPPVWIKDAKDRDKYRI